MEAQTRLQKQEQAKCAQQYFKVKQNSSGVFVPVSIFSLDIASLINISCWEVVDTVHYNFTSGAELLAVSHTVGCNGLQEVKR